MNTKKTNLQFAPGISIGHFLLINDTGKKTSAGNAIWRCQCDCGTVVKRSTVELQYREKKTCGCILPPEIKSDIRGKQYGLLTVLSYKEDPKITVDPIVRCRCQCGRCIDVQRSKLYSDAVKDCGCLSAPGRKNWTGYQFGELTVMKRSHKRDWLCKCACGGQIIASQDQLLNGEVTNCGCWRTRPVKALAGEKFGRLTALRYVGTKKDLPYWKCRCNCGKELDVSQPQLIMGLKKSCGTCDEMSLVGHKFGMLRVIEDAGMINGYHKWVCKCDCGNPNPVLVAQEHLIHERTKSCGCLRGTAAKSNLRLVDGTSVTKLERTWNSSRIQSNNTSGYNGVYPQTVHGKKTGRWVAQIGFKNHRYYLGLYDKLDDAIQVRKTAE